MIRFEEALVHHQAFDDAINQNAPGDHIVEVESRPDLKNKMRFTKSRGDSMTLDSIGRRSLSGTYYADRMENGSRTVLCY